MGSQFLGSMPRAAAAPKSSTQPQQHTVWMRARHGLWSTTGLEMTLLADGVSLFFSLQEVGVEERKLFLYLFGRKETWTGERDPSKKERHGILHDLCLPLLVEGPWGGSGIPGRHHNISGISPCPGPPISESWQRAAGRRDEGTMEGHRCAWMQVKIMNMILKCNVGEDS